MIEIWAKSSKKSGGTSVKLSEHIQDVLGAWNGLKNLVDNRLHMLIEISIVCHDWGKVLPAFQIRTLKNAGYEPVRPYQDVPHSLFSVLWINREDLISKIKNPGNEIADSPDDYANFVISAVAYHHWREKFVDLISSHNRELGELCEELKTGGYLEQLQKNLEGELNTPGNEWNSLISFNEAMADGLRNGVPFSEYARPPYHLYWLPRRAAIDEHKLRDWILISGFLLRSDHFASFCEEEGEKYQPEGQNVSFDVIKQNIETKIKDKTGLKNLNESEIWQFQKVNSLKDKNVVLVAPTGYGKTEFAFLWPDGKKFFYTLPLRAAVNQTFERAKQAFENSTSNEKVGLLHSDADVYLLGDGGEAQANLKAYDLARQLAYPVIISTGDQFFPYALRPPGYEKIYATFSYSRLVIDEVQAYDPRAAAIVVKFIEDIVRMGGKFLLMTATLPGFVKDEIDRVVGEYELLNLYTENKNRLEKIKRHRIQLELIENSTEDGSPDFTVPDEKLEKVLETASAGKRVLVIANTVKQAQDIFSGLGNLLKNYDLLKGKLWLLHSRFTLKDRQDKEKILVEEEFKNPKPDTEKEGKILVATQVVEASLDIDADVIFTEVAPLDALVQRMGRVLRRYGPMTEGVPDPEEPNVHIWVFQHGLQSGGGYVYDNDLILLTLKLLKDSGNNSLSEDYKEWLSRLPREGKDRIGRVIEEVFSLQKSKRNAPKASKKKRSLPVNLPTSISQPPLFQLICSEYDKFSLVEKLYDLPEDHAYLKEFRQTKDILDAGYMSERLREAQEIFRRIYTVSVIPSQKKDQFLQEVQKFFEQEQGDGKGLYTKFKKNVLSKFVVQAPMRFHEKWERLEWWVKSLHDLADEQRKKLVRWCSDIFVVEAFYDDEKGLGSSRTSHYSSLIL